MSLFTASRLIALPKKSGGVPPIAVGDTLRRLAAKCLLDVGIPSASMYLLPLQVGVQVPNAAERVARHVSIWTRMRAEDEVILQVDMRNAFNSLDRQEMLIEAKFRAPLLYPYMRLRATKDLHPLWRWVRSQFVARGVAGGFLWAAIVFSHSALSGASTGAVGCLVSALVP